MTTKASPVWMALAILWGSLYVAHLFALFLLTSSSFCQEICMHSLLGHGSQKYLDARRNGNEWKHFVAVSPHNGKLYKGELWKITRFSLRVGVWRVVP